ncbi:MAG TPA: T9SS type A sorting domain-containing protein, partial [Bacteroidetes bacterium]|nr:T9SS type A sorting domain-containing protein [Bacteroidota bacterium]
SLGGSASAQPASGGLPPGEGFDWERLGTPAFDADYLTFAPDGSLWSAGVSIHYASATYVYDDAADTWRDTTSLTSAPDDLAFLGPDTLLVRFNNDINRSVDGGETWEDTYDAGGEELLHVVPLGVRRSGGRVFTTARHRYTNGLAYSTDRGRRFTESVYDSSLFGTRDIRAWTALAVTRGPHAGRVLMGGIHGIATSDDGGESFRPSALWSLYHYGTGEIAEGEGPDGQPRLFSIMTDTTHPYKLATHSDDGGETWSAPVSLPEPQDGVGDRGGLVWLGPAGQPRSVLAILPRGHIYRTDDGGGSWSLVGRAPVPEGYDRVREAVLDAEGRLIVSAARNGTVVNGVFRTVEPVPVASASAPPTVPDLSLAVEPNPSTSRTAVRWRQASAGAARVSVFDARGREVLVVADGHCPSGEHRMEVDASGLAGGVYVVRVVTPGGTASGRLSVVR